MLLENLNFLWFITKKNQVSITVSGVLFTNIQKVGYVHQKRKKRIFSSTKIKIVQRRTTQRLKYLCFDYIVCPDFWIVPTNDNLLWERYHEEDLCCSPNFPEIFPWLTGHHSGELLQGLRLLPRSLDCLLGVLEHRSRPRCGWIQTHWCYTEVQRKNYRKSTNLICVN